MDELEHCAHFAAEIIQIPGNLKKILSSDKKEKSGNTCAATFPFQVQCAGPECQICNACRYRKYKKQKLGYYDLLRTYIDLFLLFVFALTCLHSTSPCAVSSPSELVYFVFFYLLLICSNFVQRKCRLFIMKKKCMDSDRLIIDGFLLACKIQESVNIKSGMDLVCHGQSQIHPFLLKFLLLMVLLVLSLVYSITCGG